MNKESTKDFQGLVKSALIKELGSIDSFERVKTFTENTEFYDVAIVTAGDKKVVAKWDEGINKSGSQKNPAEQLKMEFEISKEMIQRGIPTAAPIIFNFSIPLFVMEYLPGRETTKQDFDEKHIREAAVILKKIHEIKEGEPGTENVYIWSGVNFKEEITFKFYERFNGVKHFFADNQKQRIEDAFNKLISKNDYLGVKRLSRRDIHPGNWYLHENGHLFIIDHGWVGFNDVALDLMQVRERLVTSSKMQQAFRDSYGAENYDESSQPITNALVSITQQVGVLGYIERTGSQPKYKKKTLERLEEVFEFSESL